MLLRAHPSVELVPICRNRTGSAFLRYNGFPCRHGRIANAREAQIMLGDCDIVLNFAWPIGPPRETRDVNRRLIENSIAYSMPQAKIVYFSTQCVYRSFRPSEAAPWRSAYGKEKLRCERLVRRSADRHGKQAFVLRLGNVCGELQNMSLSLRNLIRSGPVLVPREGERPSYVVYTVTIVDAILQILSGFESAGTYDLINSPPWTWKQVLEHEARLADHSLTIASATKGPTSALERSSQRLLSAMRRVTQKSLSAPVARDIGLRLLTHMPTEQNDRAQAMHYLRRVAKEIQPSLDLTPSSVSFTFGSGGIDFLSSLSTTEELLEASRQNAGWSADLAFPPDMPPTIRKAL